MLSRFPDAEITGFEQRHHELAWIPSKQTNSKGFQGGEWATGKFNWIVYRGPENHSTLEIFRNYEKVLKDAGFEFGFSCQKKECGNYFIERMLEITGRMVGNSERWIPDSGRYLAAKLASKNGDVWVSLLVYQRDRVLPVIVHVNVTDDDDVVAVASTDDGVPLFVVKVRTD